MSEYMVRALSPDTWDGFAGLAQRLGFSCDTAGGLIAVRDPFALENWTLPRK